MAVVAEVLRQIDEVLGKYRELRSRSKYDDCSDQPGSIVTTVITLMSETVNRFAPRNSQYSESIKAIFKSYGVGNGHSLDHISGVLSALRIAYESGYFATVTELVHAEVFSDFVEMAQYLLSEGYKDPAAVIVGSVLEEHLRQLSARNGLATDLGGRPKKADQLNADLAGQSVYSKLDQKSITGWLDLRNKAAHGKYTEYTKEQVALLVQSVQNFMARVPA